ncbi:RNA-guided endonuclease InsQ/TnpB family protein [Streptomyces sp. NPDC101234]|uniref:RNA-guided endonuclease InsQ/TnpB family protein n=1 Tax=Streptomyces sp. NPDC101234 TaxID=3366138 RepID=UPI00380CA763
MNYVPQAAELADAKRDHAWLRCAPPHVLQQTLMDLDRACRTQGTFKVRWRSKNRWAPGFRFPAGNRIMVERLNRRWGRAKLPKLGWVVFRWTRPPGGEIRSATVSCRAGHWYLSFLVEDLVQTPDHHPGTPVGVDRGIVVAVTTSTGDFHDREFATPGEGRRYRRLQQKLARSKKGSASRRKTLAAMARIMARVVDRRADFTAWTANRLTKRHSVVVLEDLHITDMTGSAKGDVEQPGKKVRQKAGLNRAILDKGWHRLEVAIRKAARSTGTEVLLVNPAYTSQTCNRCKHVDAKSRKSQAVFVCTACGHRDHADVNAAKNVLSAAGHAVPACGDLAAGRSVKQEPAAPRGVPRQPVSSLVGIPSP